MMYPCIQRWWLAAKLDVRDKAALQFLICCQHVFFVKNIVRIQVVFRIPRTTFEKYSKIIMC